MDWQTALRLASIFGTQNPQNQDMFAPTPTFGGSYNPGQAGNMGGVPTGVPVTPGFNPNEPHPVSQTIMDRMKDMYKPQTTSIDKFNDMITKYPTMPQPGKLRKIGAVGLASLGDLYGPKGSGGTAFSEMMGYGKYGRDIADWEKQVKPLEQAANIERQGNVNERQFAYQAAATQLREEAQAEKERKNDVDAKIKQQRADVYSLKANQGNMKFDFSGPTVKVADPRTGKVSDTGIPTGHFSDAEKMSLGQENEMARIDRRTEGAMAVEDVRQGGRSALGYEVFQRNNPDGTVSTFRINKDTGAVEPVNVPGGGTITKPGTVSGAESRPPLPTQVRVDQFVKARQLFNTRPDLRPFIKLNPQNNTFEIQQSKKAGTFTGASGPNPEQMREITETIYGKQGGGTPQTPGGGPMSPVASHNQPMTRTQRNRVTGETRIQISNDGGKTWRNK